MIGITLKAEIKQMLKQSEETLQNCLNIEKLLLQLKESNKQNKIQQSQQNQIYNYVQSNTNQQSPPVNLIQEAVIPKQQLNPAIVDFFPTPPPQKILLPTQSLHNIQPNVNYFSSSQTPNKRYWQQEEHQRFLEALFLNQNSGKDAIRISQYVKTRSADQVRSHSQKFALRLQQLFAEAVELSNLQSIQNNLADIVKNVALNVKKNLGVKQSDIQQIDAQLFNFCIGKFNLQKQYLKTNQQFNQQIEIDHFRYFSAQNSISLQDVQITVDLSHMCIDYLENCIYSQIDVESQYKLQIDDEQYQTQVFTYIVTSAILALKNHIFDQDQFFYFNFMKHKFEELLKQQKQQTFEQAVEKWGVAWFSIVVLFYNYLQ